MSITSRFARLAGVLAIVAVAGCATVSLLPEELDAKAKGFAPPPQKANLYVTRQVALGGAYLFQIFLDGKLAGSIASGTYLLFEVEPGNRQVAVVGQESQHAVTVAVAAGENHFLDVSPLIGWIAPRAELVLLPASEGKTVVAGAKRAEDFVNVAAPPAKVRAAPAQPDANIRFQSQGSGAGDKGVERGWMECGNQICPKRK